MDTDNSLDDNTAIHTMRKHFNMCLAGSTRKRPAASMLDFQESYIESGDSSISKLRAPSSQARSASKGTPVTMEQLFEKEKEDRLRQSELVKARATITDLERKIISLNTNMKQEKVEHERALDKLKLEHKTEHEQLSTLKAQLRAAAMKEEQVRTELLDTKATMKSSMSALEQKVRQLQADRYKMEGEFQEKEQSLRSSVGEMRREKLRQQSELDICRSDLADAQEQLQTALRRCTDLNSQLQESSEAKHLCDKLEQRIKELEQEKMRMEDQCKVGLAYKSQLSRLQELESENRKLRDENNYHKETHENVVLLQEKVEGLRSQLERAQQRCEGYSQLQIDHEDVKARLARWEEGVKSEQWPKDPAELWRRMADLQSTNAMLLEREGVLKSNAHSSHETQQATEGELMLLKDQVTKAQHNTKLHSDTLKRVQRKLMLITKERDSYKSILDSYESEMTSSVGGGGGTVQLQSRLHGAESLCRSYEAEVAQLETDLESVTLQMSQATTRTLQLEEELRRVRSQRKTKDTAPVTTEADQKLIASLREKIVDVEKSLEKALQDKEVLEGRLERHDLQGDYDPTTTKVLHLRLNPADIAQRERAEQVRSLTAENTRLTERLKVVEEAGAAAQDVTMQVEERLQQPQSSQQLEDVKQQLSSAELKNKRLMEAFKKTSQEFREVCYRLLGYRIDISGTNQYKLMNMYSESPEDFLLFKQTQDGELQILGTDFSNSLQDNIEHYLTTGHSIPAFLSSITMELFSRQTIMS